METSSLPLEQQQLFKLLLQANTNQTSEIKSEIQQSINKFSQQIEETKEELEQFKKRCVNLERKNRKNNVLIFGAFVKIKERGSCDLLEETVKLLNKLLGTTLSKGDINNIYKVGKSSNPSIALEFVSYLKKISLFQDKEKLKQLSKQGISLGNDSCKEDREEQKVLRTHLKIARTQNLEAKIKNYKLLINDTWYTAEELQKLEVEHTDSDSNCSNSSVGDYSSDIIEGAEEEGAEPKQETTNQDRNKVRGNMKNRNRPVAQKKTSKLKEGQKTIYKYNPKNTRSKKPHKK